MSAIHHRTTQHLTLDKLVVSPRLARRLPPALAFRYHALPVAEDRNRVTVAMADPEDSIARAAVAAALGTRLYVVQSDPAVIDGLLTEIWPQTARHPLRLLVYHRTSPISDEVKSYAQYMCDLLDGDLSTCQAVAGTDNPVEDLTEAGRGHDLVVFGELDKSLVERLLQGAADNGARERLSASVLVARQPRWPLRRVLLVIRDQGADDVAVDWVVHLAQPSKAAVTVLAVVPPVPAMCGYTDRMQHGLAEWLATDTALGRQLRRIGRRLMNWEAEGTLRFRQGPPDWQVQREVAEGDYDLIAIAADPNGRWLRRLSGELVSPLLRWTNRPVLIAKPTAR